MRAYVLDGPGPPNAFRLEERPPPAVRPGWVLVRVRAFGLNRSELFSRKGLSSPDFSFPRVLGLECAGEVIDPSDSDLAVGQRVLAMMGGMGRSFDGSYATHALLPRSQVFAVETSLEWPVLGAIPETYNTAWGVCFETMGIDGDDRILIRGGTSALGRACTEIARDLGCFVATTSRSPGKAEALDRLGRASVVFVDGPDLADRVLADFGPMTGVVDGVGSKESIESACAMMPDGGTLGLVGMLSETWDSPDRPVIPPTIRSDFYASDSTASPRDDAKIREIVARVEAGRYQHNIYRVFPFDGLPEAHRVMEANEAMGKLVIEVDG